MTTEHCKKSSFPNEKAAKDFIEVLRKKSNKPTIPEGYYQCPKCNNWHLTRYPQTINRQLEREVRQLKAQLIERDNKIKNLHEIISIRDEKIKNQTEYISGILKLNRRNK